MKINSRMIDIFNYVRANSITSIKDIALDLDLKERSVRYEIENINYILRLNKLEEIQKLSKGGLLFTLDKRVLNIFENFVDLEKVSKEERLDYIILKLLIEGSINISQISRKIDVCRSTIKNDLKEIEEIFNLSQINIINNKIFASEKDIRNYILRNYYMDISKLYYLEDRFLENKTKIQEMILRYVNYDDLCSVKTFVDTLSEKFKNNNKFYELIFSYIIISYIRVKDEKRIEFIENKSFLKSTAEYEYIADNIQSLENSLNIKYDELEILMLTDYVLGTISYAYNTLIFENWIEIRILVKEIIKNVAKHISINILNDDILVEGLLNHIKPTIYRVKNDLSIEEELYYQSIASYPELYSIVKKALFKLEILIGKEFGESETALFTIHFLASIKRNEDKLNDDKAILLVCGGGYGTSAILKNILEENYKVSVIDSVSYFQLLNYDLSNVDLIVSTVKLNKDICGKLKKPIALITPFFTFEDDEELKKYNILRSYKNKNISLTRILDVIRNNAIIKDEGKLIKDLSQLVENRDKIESNKAETLFDTLSPSKVEILDSVKDWKEALNICGEKLITTKEINPEYLEEIFSVIETFGAYFVLGNKIAIPHGQFKVNVNSPCMSILYVKKGVVFLGDKDVRLIILIASSEKNILINTVESINLLSQKKDLYEDIENFHKEEELIEYLRNVTNKGANYGN